MTMQEILDWMTEHTHELMAARTHAAAEVLAAYWRAWRYPSQENRQVFAVLARAWREPPQS